MKISHKIYAVEIILILVLVVGLYFLQTWQFEDEVVNETTVNSEYARTVTRQTCHKSIHLN